LFADVGALGWADALTQSVLYVAVGIFLVAFGAFLTDLLTPGKLGEEIFKKRNLALGLVTIGGMLGDGYIIAAVIGGHPNPDTLIPMMSGSLNILANTVVYALGGMAVKIVAYKTLDLVTPSLDFRTALAENNTAAGLTLGGLFAVIGFVIAAPLAS
jgi:uncharacterized membrane protein YjfL (UPF0719 family)